MTIDTNELRRLAQAATPGPWEVAYTDQNGQAVIKGKHIEIATCWHHCVGSIEKEMYANAALIAAANPAAISEFLDRLEEVESARRDDYQNWMTALDRNAGLLAKLEGAEKAVTEAYQRGYETGQEEIAAERDAQRTALEKIADWDSAWGPYPETNEAWRAMVVVTAREAVPRRGEKK